jgi:hypothetical protein
MSATSTLPTTSDSPWRRRAAFAAIVSLVIGTVGASAISLATFTDSKTSSGSFTSGTIVLGVAPATLFTLTSIMPGDSGSASLTVTNSGTGALRYAVTSASTNADTKSLRDQIALTVKAGACPGAGGNLYSGALSAAAIGDPTAGNQTGDRTLAATTSEQLCFAWSLPIATGNAYQGAATTTTFTFSAEQTANNP